MTQEQLKARQEMLREDRAVLVRMLSSPDGERALRYLESLWCEWKVGTAEQNTARLSFHCAFHDLVNLRKEGTP